MENAERIGDEQVFARITHEQSLNWQEARTKGGQAKKRFWAEQLKAGRISKEEFDFIIASEERGREMAKEMIKRALSGRVETENLDRANPEDCDLGQAANELYIRTLLTIWAKGGLIEMRVTAREVSA